MIVSRLRRGVLYHRHDEGQAVSGQRQRPKPHGGDGPRTNQTAKWRLHWFGESFLGQDDTAWDASPKTGLMVERLEEPTESERWACAVLPR